MLTIGGFGLRWRTPLKPPMLLVDLTVRSTIATLQIGITGAPFSCETALVLEVALEQFAAFKIDRSCVT